ncbi:hypothetical protein [Mycobacterium intracellulare]|uniref:hypothetical protein n=1 Tax=Mycobacterium intracellulare TaxID=1767 RepID=UPI00109EC81D|nr:hypothetical protein [Mycobacterium intracellulare]
MTAANDFVRQFAVLMPNGQLHPQPIKGEPVEDYSISSAQRDMFSGFLSMFGATPTSEAPTIGSEPVIFQTREAAEKVLNVLRSQAEQFGVTNWGGTVVERLSTPFVWAEPEVQFRNDIITWMEQRESGHR